MEKWTSSGMRNPPKNHFTGAKERFLHGYELHGYGYPQAEAGYEISQWNIQWKGSAVVAPGIPCINGIIMEYHIKWRGNITSNAEHPRIPGDLRLEEPRTSGSWCKNH